MTGLFYLALGAALLSAGLWKLLDFRRPSDTPKGQYAAIKEFASRE